MSTWVLPNYPFFKLRKQLKDLHGNRLINSWLVLLKTDQDRGLRGFMDSGIKGFRDLVIKGFLGMLRDFKGFKGI